MGLIPHYSGVVSEQSFARLKDELVRARCALRMGLARPFRPIQGLCSLARGVVIQSNIEPWSTNIWSGLGHWGQVCWSS